MPFCGPNGGFEYIFYAICRIKYEQNTGDYSMFVSVKYNSFYSYP